MKTIFGAEIGMLLFGLYAIFTGKLTLAKHRDVEGPAARLLGLVGCAPVPVSFIAQTAYLRMHNLAHNNVDSALRRHMIAIEAGVLVVCMAILYAVGLPLSKAHQKIAHMQTGDAKSAYFQRAEVAADMLHVFAKSLEFNPEDNELRS